MWQRATSPRTMTAQLHLSIHSTLSLNHLTAFITCHFHPFVPMTDRNSRSRLQIAGDRLSAMASTVTGRPSHGFPAFDDLPEVEGQPQGCLWGHFDKGQKKDEVGSKQSQTPDEPWP